jgi:hypothetical protein
MDEFVDNIDSAKVSEMSVKLQYPQLHLFFSMLVHTSARVFKLAK